MSRYILKVIHECLNENIGGPTEQQYMDALDDVRPLIPTISGRLIKSKGLEHNRENLIKFNKIILERIKSGDKEILDELSEMAWSRLIQYSIYIISEYHR